MSLTQRNLESGRMGWSSSRQARYKMIRQYMAQICDKFATITRYDHADTKSKVPSLYTPRASQILKKAIQSHGQ